MFEVLEHPADVGFRAFGRTLPELYENSAWALLSIRGELEAIEARQEYPIQATGTDRESLLVNWLNEVLYLVDARQVALRGVRIDRLGEESVESTGLGEARDPERHPLKVIVKAVTWHQLKIARVGERWVAEVYLDI
jgi:protein archease